MIHGVRPDACCREQHVISADLANGLDDGGNELVVLLLCRAFEAVTIVFLSGVQLVVRRGEHLDSEVSAQAVALVALRQPSDPGCQ
jgi:hypothetical protein